MAWKKSKDGGMDYDPTPEQVKEETFNFAATGMTMTFDFNQEVLPVPKRSVKKRFEDYKRRRGLA